MATVAEEFLYRIGFDVNQDQLSKLLHASSKVTKSFLTVGGTIATVRTAITTGLAVATLNTQKLYHEANKIGTNITNLKGAEEAFKRFGGSAQDAHTALNNLATRMKTIPNFSEFLEQNLGVKTFDKTTGKMRDMKDILKDVIKAMQKMPQEERVATAQLLGLDGVIDTIMQRGFVTELDKQTEAMGNLGGSMDKNQEKARKFQNSIKDISSTLSTGFQSEFLEILNITGADEWLQDFSNRLRSVLPDFFKELNRYLKLWSEGKLWSTIGQEMAASVNKKSDEYWANMTDEEIEERVQEGDQREILLSNREEARKKINWKLPQEQQKIQKQQLDEQRKSNEALKKIAENTEPFEDLTQRYLIKGEVQNDTSPALSVADPTREARGKGAHGLEPRTEAKLNDFRANIKKELGPGYDIEVTEGFRSAARQDALFAKGPSVTRAKGGQSKHNWGTAFDVHLTKDGKRVPNYYSDKEMLYKVGEIGERSGLKWGGRFPGFFDGAHFERPESIRQIRKEIEGRRIAEKTRAEVLGTPPAQPEKPTPAPAPAKPGQTKGASSPVASVDPNWVNPTSEDVKKTLAGTLAAYGFTVKPSTPPANGKNVSVIVNQNNNFPNATNAGEIQHGLDLAVNSNSQILSRAVGSQGVV